MNEKMPVINILVVEIFPPLANMKYTYLGIIGTKDTLFSIKCPTEITFCYVYTSRYVMFLIPLLEQLSRLGVLTRNQLQWSRDTTADATEKHDTRNW